MVRRVEAGERSPGRTGTKAIGLFVFSVVVAGMMATPVSAKAGTGMGSVGMQGQDTTRKDTLVFRADPLVVTATRTARHVFATPVPVAVIDSTALRRRQPNTVTDLFRSVPGVDVNGVGVQQPRPVIRGQRGQRILLLEDGLRLNSSRRQQDFGEIPGLVDPSQVERVEVVRGPASVLYGTDAIGGVVNIITRRPTTAGLHGTADYTYGAEENQHRGTANLFGRYGRLDFQVDGAVRRADSYEAPSGRFGNIELSGPTRVNGTGVKDWNLAGRAAWSMTSDQSVSLRVERYESEDASFGYVDPSAYAPSQPKIDIAYPWQHFTRATAAYTASNLSLPVADRFEAQAWWQGNRRKLTFDLFQGFGPQAPPGAGVQINTFNVTDMSTTGMRLEAKKLVPGGVLLTYGIDYFRDASENTDSSVTTVVGFGPPQTDISTTPQVPNATYRSVGGFAQGEMTAGRLTLIAGLRGQDVQAKVASGQGVADGLTSKSSRTVVGSANALIALTPTLSLVGTVGRGFRAPNLIEWFFDGPTPEGNGYQVRSPDLRPETSLNVDLGLRYRDSRVALEAFGFRNKVKDGIRIQPTGEMVQGFPAYQNVNVDRLLFRGIEGNADVLVGAGFSTGGSYTWLDSHDELDPSNPIGDSFSNRLTGFLRWTTPGGRFWSEYAVRHNGERKDVALDTNPLGDVLPAFTVHDVTAGLLLRRRNGTSQRLMVSVQNLTDELYAEFTNASFFRPEPRRRVTLGLGIGF
jgi:hemoglobin/transferrin/lactoferrin receptor protein